MKYDNQNLLDELAVDYILGTMRGAARRRFQKLMMSPFNTIHIDSFFVHFPQRTHFS